MDKKIISKISYYGVLFFTIIIFLNFYSCNNPSKDSTNLSVSNDSVDLSSGGVIVGTAVGIDDEDDGDDYDDEQMETQSVKQKNNSKVAEKKSQNKGGGNTPPVTEPGTTTQTGVGQTENPSDEYEVRLKMKKKIPRDKMSTLSVIIGAKGKYIKEKTEKEVEDVAEVGNVGGMYAKVLITANDFDVTYNGVKECLKVNENGTTNFYFSLNPKNTGECEVSATVLFYQDCNCEGLSPISTGPDPLTVKVRVGFFKKIWTEIEDHIAGTISTLVILILGAILFFARNLIKKKTGYEEQKVESTVDNTKTIVSKVKTTKSVKTAKTAKAVEVEEEVEEAVETDDNNDE